LIVNGTAGAVVVKNYGSLGGSGTVGAVTLESGALLNPGNSPGTLTAASSSWAAGSTYNWEINQASGGTAGVNWDLFDVTNALDLRALSSNAKMNLVLNSLGSMDDFFTDREYSWVIAQAGSFIGSNLEDGTDVTSLFNINTAAFNGGTLANLPNGGFQVVTGTDSNNLRTLTLRVVNGKATPTINVAPTARAITVGQTLADSTLDGGIASVNGTQVLGTFAFAELSIAPNAGTANHEVTFTPTDTANYNTATTTVSVTVNSAGPTIDTAYPGKDPLAINPDNGLTYLLNYAFGGSDTTAPRLPVMDTSDPTKLTLVAYVRTGGDIQSVVGETASTLPSFDSVNTIPGEVIDPSDAPPGMEKRKYSVMVSGDRKFLRLKVTKR
jgi:hypothetical protein